VVSELYPRELHLISAELRETVDLLRRGFAQVRVRDRDGAFALADQLAKMAARLDDLRGPRPEEIAGRPVSRRGSMPHGALRRRRPHRWPPQGR